MKSSGIIGLCPFRSIGRGQPRYLSFVRLFARLQVNQPTWLERCRIAFGNARVLLRWMANRRKIDSSIESARRKEIARRRSRRNAWSARSCPFHANIGVAVDVVDVGRRSGEPTTSKAERINQFTDDKATPATVPDRRYDDVPRTLDRRDRRYVRKRRQGDRRTPKAEEACAYRRSCERCVSSFDTKTRADRFAETETRLRR